MATTNDITGDKLITKAANDNYRDNYDRIFGKKNVQKQETTGDSTEIAVPELRKAGRNNMCGSFESGS